MKTTVQLLLLHAQTDHLYKEDLIRALGPFQKQGKLRIWHEGDIKPGENREAQMAHFLEGADAVLPLLSPDFFASETLLGQLDQALARQAQDKCQVLPVVIRACAWQADERLAPLKVLPSDGKPIGSWTNRDEAYQAVVEAMRRAWWPDTAPLPSLKPPKTWGERFQQYKVALEVAAALTTVLTLWLTYCPPRPSEDAATHKAYTAAKTPGTIPALRAFLAQHPQGAAADSARQILRGLQHRFDSCLQSANALLEGGEAQAAQSAAAAAARLDPEAPELKKFYK